MYIHKVHKKMFRVIFFFIMRVEHDNLPRFFRAAFFFVAFQNIRIRLFVHSISEEEETALFEFGFQDKTFYIIKQSMVVRRVSSSCIVRKM